MTGGNYAAWHEGGTETFFLGTITADPVYEYDQYYSSTFPVNVSSPPGIGAIGIDFGFMGNGQDAWMQLDDVELDCW